MGFSLTANAILRNEAKIIGSTALPDSETSATAADDLASRRLIQAQGLLTSIPPPSPNTISSDSCISDLELPMSVQVKKHLPALKHAGYAATGILPGENRAEFEKLHRDLIDEHGPEGALENDIVETMARYVWRKKHLETFRIAELARAHYAQIRHEKIPEESILLLEFGKKADPAVREAAIRASEDQAR